MYYPPISRLGGLLAMLLLAACSGKKSLTVLTDKYSSPGKAVIPVLSQALAPVSLNMHERVVDADSEVELLELVNSGKADMAIVKNDTYIDEKMENLRTVAPLFPDVFLLLVKERHATAPIHRLLERGKVALIIDKSEEETVIHHFWEVMQVHPQHVSVFRNAGDSLAFGRAARHADVIVTFSSINNPELGALLGDNGFRIYNNAQLTGASPGSQIDGFCVRFPQAVPYTIPQGIFEGFPEAAIKTFAIYDVLVCHKDIEPAITYDVNESIFHAKAFLAQQNFEFGLLQEDFNDHTFIFPLHEGTSAYLNRNQPSFWERYAEIIGLVGSVLVVLTGWISRRYSQWKQRRKDKIDEYYLRVMEISDKAHHGHVGDEELSVLLEELRQIRNHAFKLLVNEHVAADNAFVIFQMLLQSTVQHLETLRVRPPVPGLNNSMNDGRFYLSPN
jgi:TRAP-type uncharacterized transport system substrate-binding protein